MSINKSNPGGGKRGVLILLSSLVLIFMHTGSALSANPQIAAGGDHTIALKSDGTVWAWGANWSGQHGDDRPLFLPRQALINLVAPRRNIVDFDGDGKADVAVYRAQTGACYVRPSGGGSPYGMGWGGDASDIPITTNPASYLLAYGLI